MQRSSRTRALACAVAALQEAGTSTQCLFALKRPFFSTRTYTHPFSAEQHPEENIEFNATDQEAAAATAAMTLPSSSSSSAAPQQRYRRRSSNPQTPREKADFRRDYKYAKHRPLPDAPWRQLKTRTYLDDAERLYGRKETWHSVEDAVLREKLVAILQDYLRDTLAAARLEAKEARKYHHLCSIAAKQYRAHVSSGAFGLADGMQAWALDVLKSRSSTLQSKSASGEVSADTTADSTDTLSYASSSPILTEGDVSMTTPSATSTDETAAAEFREKRRRRGEQAVLAHTAAITDLPDADVRHTPQSAFPFLRRRAVEDESTLDPSLVDWTAKYFPEDDARTFAEPPKLRQHGGGSARDTAGEEDGGGDASSRNEQRTHGFGFGGPRVDTAGNAVDPASLNSTATSRRATSVHARHRLQRTLRDHENRHRSTFDAEGVYYKVRRQSEVDERAPKPQAVKASDLEPAGRRSEVVKVPWSVASKAKAQGYSSETLRAKERLIRLTRGEDPETIP
ncbi:putative mitochondrial hypothetical protein [Leptomonas pyrrhocoris]|uniref:Uncharacterized protein n=1 Tax=Leptomonas pyrrhocoris TaxID=157538 RepID=A0A0M9G9G1_LEPPY|nr:putative mitochondrial hypothetical protein [Leptomonas pyrrhocoris]KPA85457.1 putative mitochondrial hypothetical protein [Leptomonas pyrrhocoris]|eukprot:XP_015663896.1 putative mitochondrial hypothetical protein [Leptomonas pyrrhocoris]